MNQKGEKVVIQEPRWKHWAIWGVFLAGIFLFNAANAQEKLKKLVEEREILHREWQESESQKTGIFGNRTKRDLIATQEWMSRIIQKDNQIMAELEMLKDIETTTISHEKEDYKFIAQKQQNDIGILKRALAEKELEVEKAKADGLTNEWAAFLLFLTTLVFGYLYFKARKIHNDQPVG
ncbi:Clp protease ClpB [Lunatimonas salinarum]|uniref:Clp protease ClpB n=1 Tax=Lunatimonas salinarum TaxID=1774590 RepID=UPI001FD7E6D4|nr:Clp protease ClpB [Lunatimonas salinarum]